MHILKASPPSSLSCVFWNSLSARRNVARRNLGFSGFRASAESFCDQCEEKGGGEQPGEVAPLNPKP